MHDQRAVKSEQLFSHIPEPRVGKLGIADQDVARIKITSRLITDLLECLRSPDDSDVRFGLFFAECLKARPEFTVAAGSAFTEIETLIRSSLAHPNPLVQADGLRAFAAFRDSYSDYSQAMLAYLSGIDGQMRYLALGFAPTFLTSKDISRLLPFAEDREIGETGGMGGPLRYINRDLALEVAERISGIQFNSGDCMERHDGVTVSWRSWSALSQWLERRSRWSVLELFR